MQKHVNLVDLVKSFPTNILLQNLASIQKRTSHIEFAHLAEKSETGSISNLSTKAARAARRRGCSRATAWCWPTTRSTKRRRGGRGGGRRSRRVPRCEDHNRYGFENAREGRVASMFLAPSLIRLSSYRKVCGDPAADSAAAPAP